MASLNLFKAALSGVLASPTSFFDTTPMGINQIASFQWRLDQTFFTGRILSRLSKDQSIIDQELPLTLMQVRDRAVSVSIY